MSIYGKWPWNRPDQWSNVTAYLSVEMMTAQDFLAFSDAEKRKKEIAQDELSQNGLRISYLFDCAVWVRYLIENSEKLNLNISKSIKEKPNELEKLKKNPLPNLQIFFKIVATFIFKTHMHTHAHTYTHKETELAKLHMKSTLWNHYEGIPDLVQIAQQAHLLPSKCVAMTDKI